MATTLTFGGGNVVGSRGTAAVGSGLTSLAVSFTNPLPYVPSAVLAVLRSTTGGANIFANVLTNTITANGFSVAFNGVTDATTTELDYLALR